MAHRGGGRSERELFRPAKTTGSDKALTIPPAAADPIAYFSTADARILMECIALHLATRLVSPAAGDHPIEIRYVQRGWGNALILYWEPPGQTQQLIAPGQWLPVPAPLGQR